MFGLTDEQFEDFNIWVNYIYITSRGRKVRNGKRFITVRDRKKQLILGTKEYYDWAVEKIQEFKKINLIK